MLINIATLPVFLGLFKGYPLVDVAGAYFPAWLACMMLGAFGTWLCHFVAERTGYAEALSPALLLVPSLFIAITASTWLLIFSAR